MQRETCQFCLILAPFYSESVMNKFEGVIIGRFNKLSIQKNRIIIIFMKTIEINASTMQIPGPGPRHTSFIN